MSTVMWVSFVVMPLAFYSIIVTIILLGAKQRQAARRARQELTVASSLAGYDKDRLLQEKADEALRLNQTIQKFIPRQFMHHLNKGDAESLELGHAVEDDVAILFCDIRGFTGLSEKLQPHELIRFLNSYFLRMNGPIHQYNGFIDKFIGDAIMAIFDHPGGTAKNKAQDAIKAAIALQKTVALYNEHRLNCEYDPVGVGVGIHYGAVTIGTVGSDDRMDTTVIGDNVNVAARLESLTTQYDVGIIISEETLEAAGPEFKLNTRVLDFIHIKGRIRPVRLFEVLDHLSEEQQNYKSQTKDLIQIGLDSRVKKQWSLALDCFQQALYITPDDPLIAHHIEMCRRCQNMPIPEAWDGAMSAPV